MYNRVDTGTAVGGGMLGGGTVAEMSKKAAENPAKDIMEIDILFGLIPGYYLHLGGFIAILGSIILVYSAIRGHREKKKREAKDKHWIDTRVRDLTKKGD